MAADMDYFDQIYCMDTDNYNEVKRISGNKWNAAKTALLLESLYPGQNKSVPDPWYGEEPGYHDVYHLIERACVSILEEVKSEE
jgi:protein-tyrosine phosphatase